MFLSWLLLFMLRVCVCQHVCAGVSKIFQNRPNRPIQTAQTRIYGFVTVWVGNGFDFLKTEK